MTACHILIIGLLVLINIGLNDMGHTLKRIDDSLDQLIYYAEQQQQAREASSKN